MAIIDKQKQQRTIATIAILFAVALLAGGEIVYTHRSKSNPDQTLASTTQTKGASTTSTSGDQPATPTTGATTGTTGTYKDGTYKGKGSYSSPAGQESISISVTLKGGVVTASSATSGADDLTAKEYQSDFISNYKTQVVGKNIAEIKLSRVSGSSLTSMGFNDALNKIKTQAQG